jgi:hypothetical protein
MQENSAILTLEFAGLVMNRELEGLGAGSGCLFYASVPNCAGGTNEKHKSQAEFPVWWS